ncbi:zinc finger CCCH domain-containing protein 46-like isoform X2 [Glycine soja]|uniref:C3H1-type domain-containing protein n=1 Tax=Glycine max TaxID=3847 RepID=A0A0R0HF83_SOYBN|nr:zinc finger CCCH domain-containing protein 46-like isoform X2 [Glycine soja]|eukprot:XP_014619454.1 zinc finger CCCH domain-containing protein 46 isoform X2 [Glycine max]
MRDICRNFQRGSCQYGERCRYLHVQQQRKPNVNGFGGQSSSYQQQNTNPFGFGSGSQQQQQQKGNPFGFGKQNSSQLNGGPHSEHKPNQYKPFENKWNRQSSKPQQNGVKSENNSKQTDHICTDPENCKRQIAVDFEQEKPLWILTCYSHCKGAPCDIVGDISYEELRASAYEDAKRGMNLQSIVEKERNILNSKLVEFQKLLSEPYQIPISSSLGSPTPQSIVANANANPFSTSQSNGPLSVSSFSQLSTPLNMGFERPSAPLTNTLTKPGFFGSGGNSLASNNAANLNSSAVFGVQSGPYSTPVDLNMFPGSTQQTLTAFNNSDPTTMFQTTPDVQLSSKKQKGRNDECSKHSIGSGGHFQLTGQLIRAQESF